MSRALWETVLAALDDVDVLIERAIPPGTVAGKGIGVAALRVLRAEIKGRLDQLQDLLAAMYDPAEAERMLLPLVFYLDERVMALLPLADKLAWPLLQDDVIPGDDGGEVFYKNADTLLNIWGSGSPSASSAPNPGLKPPAKDPALQLYYYCLGDGFHGRFDDAASIEAYKRRLRAAIAPDDAASTSPTDATEPDDASGSASAPLPGPRLPTAVYIAGTVVLAALIYVLPALLSNL